MTGSRTGGAVRIAGIAVLLSLALSAGPADSAGERWKDLPGKSGEERILYDADSIVPSGPNRFRVWIASIGGDGSPRRSREEVDCVNRIVRDVEVIVERPGKPLSHAFTPGDWRDVPRGTPRGELLKVLCR